jgi:PD-(D/E)XK nuclease superfamily
VRLFREQYRPGGRRTLHAKPGGDLEADSVLLRLRRDGALSEVRLEHPALPLAGILDLVFLEEPSAVVIVDFKTGVAKDTHNDQLLVYAILWWRVTGQLPARIELQYLNDGWGETVSKADLERVERKIGKEIKSAVEALAQQPAPARPARDCARCPVRARCDDGWRYAEPAGAPTGRTADCEFTLSSAPTPTGFSARRRDGRNVSVVYDFAAGKTLLTLTTGSRLRLVDAVVAAEEGKTLEIRAWSECYLL